MDLTRERGMRGSWAAEADDPPRAWCCHGWRVREMTWDILPCMPASVALDPVALTLTSLGTQIDSTTAS